MIIIDLQQIRHHVDMKIINIFQNLTNMMIYAFLINQDFYANSTN
jgi:hypothetical protein